MREKRREDLLRRLTGWSMLRLVWADLERPAATAAIIREIPLRSPLSPNLTRPGR